jgi:hypothetical protein
MLNSAGKGNPTLPTTSRSCSSQEQQQQTAACDFPAAAASAVLAAAEADKAAAAASSQVITHATTSSSSSSVFDRITNWAGSGLGLPLGLGGQRRRTLQAATGATKSAKVLEVYETCENMRVLITDSIAVPCNFEALVKNAADIEADMAKMYGRPSPKSGQSVSSAFWGWLVSNGYVTLPDFSSDAPLPPGSATQAAAFFSNYGQGTYRSGAGAAGPWGVGMSVVAGVAAAAAVLGV